MSDPGGTLAGVSSPSRRLQSAWTMAKLETGIMGSRFLLINSRMLATYLSKRTVRLDVSPTLERELIHERW